MPNICVSQSRGCWVDLFEEPAFRGQQLRLFGPASYVNLWVGSDDWGPEARSLVAGPAAYVLFFEELNFADSVLWLVPGQHVSDVAALPGEGAIDSMRVFDRPPFACEPGYGAYALALGGQPPRTLKLNARAMRGG